MATGSKEDISRTEHFFSIFYCVSESYIKFVVFLKKDQSQSLSIAEINVQKAIFHATLRKETC